jgi:hypothetical protein
MYCVFTKAVDNTDATVTNVRIMNLNNELDVEESGRELI